MALSTANTHRDRGWPLWGRQTICILALAALLLTGCAHYSCYGVQFNRLDFVPRGVSVVTAADEAAHPSLAWVAQQVSTGKGTGQIDGRARFDDFLAFARERKLDLQSVSIPTFLVRGVPLAIRGVNNCMM